MNKLLHIIASPRGRDSRTLQVSRVFLEAFKKEHPDCAIAEVNVFEEDMQPLVVKMVYGKYMLLSGKEVDKNMKDAWKNIERYINDFLSADDYLVSTPMWNFGIPYPLKQYIDIILQPRYLFRYTDKGVEGLAKDKKMVVVTSRGGDYSQASPMKGYDLQEPYLRTAFGFIGITDITFVNAQPMDMGVDLQKKAIQEAQASAKEAALLF
ncbi:MAG: NAD(P)H-dependent oxidoreductase [Candidatus Omnitrophota bacterium]